MDLPVVLIKLRDYLFWFGPVYLAAIGLGAFAEVALRRILHLPRPYIQTPRKPGLAATGATGATGSGSSKIVPSDRNLVLDLLWRFVGFSSAGWRVPVHLYVWAAVTQHSVSSVAILVTAALSLHLSLLRVGLALILAFALALAVPILSSNRQTTLPLFPRTTVDTIVLAPLSEWWRAFGRRFARSSDDLVIGVALGGLVIGLTPSLFSLLSTGFAAPLSELSGAAAGALVPMFPGTDAPLLAALQARGMEPGAFIAFMLAATATPLSLLRDLKKRLGLKVMIVYVSVAWLTSAILAWLVAPTIAALGVI